jgi:CO/xanthine dehydrogenase FAD-binding subunit
MRVCAARVDGETRIAVSGAGPTAVRSHAAEQAAADGADAAAERVLDDVTPHDDAIASSWYRSEVLPVLVRRALNDLAQGDR